MNTQLVAPPRTARRRSARAVLTAALASLAVLLAGCGEAQDPTEFAKKLSAGMTDVRSFHMTMDVSAGSQSVTMRADAEAAAGAMTAMKADMSVAGESIKLLIDNGRSYLGGSLLERIPGASGKSWALLDESSSNSTLAQMARAMKESGQMSGPEQYVKLAEALKSVTLKGNETVDGVSTQHYEAVIDGAEAAALQPGNPSASALRTIGSIPVEFWLDEQNRMVKFSLEMEVQNTETTTVVTVSKFNEPVEITAPSGSQVFTG